MPVVFPKIVSRRKLNSSFIVVTQKPGGGYPIESEKKRGKEVGLCACKNLGYWTKNTFENAKGKMVRIEKKNVWIVSEIVRKE